jgi:hypothetical protein
MGNTERDKEYLGVSNSIERMVTFDGELLDVEEILMDGKRLEIKLPMDL